MLLQENFFENGTSPYYKRNMYVLNKSFHNFIIFMTTKFIRPDYDLYDVQWHVYRTKP